MTHHKTYWDEKSLLESKARAFKGHVRNISRTAIENVMLELVKTFTYLGCKISYEEEKVILKI
jgi:hypothetical protein